MSFSLSILSLIVGFSLVVLVHELGHFLAAKAVGIRCEQFALGFGPAILSWRRGLGVRAGSTEKEYDQKIKDGADPKTLGETEYRWNWVPLGGYVKMMGQDDTKPGLVVNDPHSFTSKTVGQRMLVISAGVIMNIIFAAIAFTVLFFTGLRVPQAVVGWVIPMSPAQQAVRADGTPAPLRVGDQILAINGRNQYNDFRKIALNTALAGSGESLTIDVKRADGKVEQVRVTPAATQAGEIRLLGIGVEMPQVLAGPELINDDYKANFEGIPAEQRPVNPGEVVSRINGQPATKTDLALFDAAVQASDGKPVTITVKGKDGVERAASIKTVLADPFGDTRLNFLGMLPRPAIGSVSKISPAFNKLKEGDVVTAIAVAGDEKRDPSTEEFISRVAGAGAKGLPVTITVLRDGKEVVVPKLDANLRLANGAKGLAIGLRSDLDHAVVAGPIAASTASAIPAGTQIDEINGVKVTTWNDAFLQLRKAEAGKPISIIGISPSGAANTYTLSLTPADVTFLHALRYRAQVFFPELTDSRTTRNPLLATWWGVEETRDSILQVYLTLRRLVEGSVPFKGIVGPLGMAQMGTKVASQGLDYLLWFLAIISANLAVVNFLPIPVVDGGHFAFLLIEKFRGKPVSEQTMVVAQYIGLAMILTLFLAVTYQDILRLLSVH